MKKIAIMFLTVLATGLATAADTTNLTAILKGKRVEFSSDVRAQIILKSVDLLASCGYMDAKPKWGAPAEPQSIGDAQKQSHLHLVFSRPHKVEIPTEKATLQVREIVISLPLTIAGIWVRTDDGVQYFAMFDHTVCEDLQKELDKAGKP
jgi:hypothetical protein